MVAATRPGPAGGDVAITAVVAEPSAGSARLRTREARLPQPVGAQLLIEVRVAGVNYWDVMQLRGQVPLPASGIPGVEGMGVVIGAGPQAPQSMLDARVAWSKVGGSYADHVLAEAAWVVPVPDDVPDDVAGGVLMQGVTAQYLADETCPLNTGQTAVVLAAAGGVGSLLTQWLRSRDVRVVGIVGAEHKAEIARRNGADAVVVDGPETAALVRALIPEGAAAVFDGNGGPLVARGFDLLGSRGMLVLYGTAGGRLPAVDLDRLGAGSLYLTRASGRDYTGSPSSWRARAERVLGRAAAGELRMHVGARAALEHAADLHALLESRRSVGKLLLDVRPG